MTTVAYDGITLAADSRGIDDGVIMGDREIKLHKVGSSLVGMAGECCAMPAFIEFLETGVWVKEAEGCSAIVVSGVSAKLYEGNKYPLKIHAPYAIGSGAIAALAAMYAGVDAVKAVKIASRLDPGTGGRVMKMRCDA